MFINHLNGSSWLHVQYILIDKRSGDPPDIYPPLKNSTTTRWLLHWVSTYVTRWLLLIAQYYPNTCLEELSLLVQQMVVHCLTTGEPCIVTVSYKSQSELVESICCRGVAQFTAPQHVGCRPASGWPHARVLLLYSTLLVFLRQWTWLKNTQKSSTSRVLEATMHIVNNVKTCESNRRRKHRRFK